MPFGLWPKKAESIEPVKKQEVSPEDASQKPEWPKMREVLVTDDEIKRQIEINVQNDLSGNPDQKYRPGTLKEEGAGYIEQVEAEVTKRMADPKYVEEITAHLKNINNPDKHWG